MAYSMEIEQRESSDYSAESYELIADEIADATEDIRWEFFLNSEIGGCDSIAVQLEELKKGLEDCLNEIDVLQSQLNAL